MGAVINCPLTFQALAVDISLAALLGENIYNFGELLLHPIVSIVHKACTRTYTQQVQHCPGHNDMFFTCHRKAQGMLAFWEWLVCTTETSCN